MSMFGSQPRDRTRRANIGNLGATPCCQPAPPSRRSSPPRWDSTRPDTRGFPFYVRASIVLTALPECWTVAEWPVCADVLGPRANRGLTAHGHERTGRPSAGRERSGWAAIAPFFSNGILARNSPFTTERPHPGGSTPRPPGDRETIAEREPNLSDEAPMFNPTPLGIPPCRGAVCPRSN